MGSLDKQPLSPFKNYFFLFFLNCVCESFVCIYVCSPHVYLLLEFRRGHSSCRNWSFLTVVSHHASAGPEPTSSLALGFLGLSDSYQQESWVPIWSQISDSQVFPALLVVWTHSEDFYSDCLFMCVHAMCVEPGCYIKNFVTTNTVW